MEANRSQALEKLRHLSGQLHAATTITAVEGFPLWHPGIWQSYMRMVSRMSLELSDELERIKNDPACQTPQLEKSRG